VYSGGGTLVNTINATRTACNILLLVIDFAVIGTIPTIWGL